MIIDLPDTTTNEVTKTLVRLRDEGGAVALGRVLTLIIDADSGDAEGSISVANEASREHPCRVIVLTREVDRTTARLDAEIRVGGDAGASEVIVLRASGEMLAHSDTLVMPLLLPDAPIVAWWPHELPEHPAEHPIGRMAQRRITDSVACEDSVGALDRLREGYTAGDTDLAWTRLTVWRGMLAAALDQPPYEPVVRAEVSGDGQHPSVVLLAAWLAFALRCPVDLHRQPDAQALTKVVLHRASGAIEIERPDGRVATLRQPGQPMRRVAMPLRELRECVSEELRRMDADVVYGEVLEHGLDKVGA